MTGLDSYSVAHLGAEGQARQDGCCVHPGAARRGEWVITVCCKKGYQVVGEKRRGEGGKVPRSPHHTGGQLVLHKYSGAGCDINRLIGQHVDPIRHCL